MTDEAMSPGRGGERSDPLAPYRRWIRSPGDRVRWACTLEAVAPKFGNVHPSAAFVDLQLRDFIAAAEELAAVIDADAGYSVGPTIREAVIRCGERTGTNVNLGIALLIVPLVHAERLWASRGIEGGDEGMREALGQVLERLDARDGQAVFEAIRVAQPGGLGRVSEMDVHDASPVDLVAAMRLAADRDRVARQYASGFADLFQGVIPVVDEAVRDLGDVLLGVREAQLRLLAREPDSLIARKCGSSVAATAQSMAAEIVGLSEPRKREAAERAFDEWLRADGHRRNPGTTADLIAAALYVLLAQVT